MFSNTLQDAAPRQSRLNGLQLLLVEDNPTNQIVASELLSNEGALVDIAPGGTFALAMLDQNPDKYDLVLMDIQLPGMDGVEATARIRELTEGKHLPIIAVTANALPGDKEAYLAAGMDDYLSKPIEPRQLHRILAQWGNACRVAWLTHFLDEHVAGQHLGGTQRRVIQPCQHLALADRRLLRTRAQARLVLRPEPDVVLELFEGVHVVALSAEPGPGPRPSTMRAAPSTMSSGGWKRCSATLRSACAAGSSSVTQPVSTLFMWMPSAW